MYMLKLWHSVVAMFFVPVGINMNFQHKRDMVVVLYKSSNEYRKKQKQLKKKSSIKLN